MFCRPWCRPGSRVAVPVETGHEQRVSCLCSCCRLACAAHTVWRLLLFTSRRCVCIQIFSRSAMEGIKPLTALLLLSRFASGALHTGSSLLTWDYSKISGSTGLGTNTKFLDCLAIDHTKKKKKVEHFCCIFHTALKWGCRLWEGAVPNHSAFKGNAKQGDWSGAVHFSAGLFPIHRLQLEVLVCVGPLIIS